jgi:hypothetical protein
MLNSTLLHLFNHYSLGNHICNLNCCSKQVFQKVKLLKRHASIIEISGYYQRRNC